MTVQDILQAVEKLSATAANDYAAVYTAWGKGLTPAGVTANDTDIKYLEGRDKALKEVLALIRTQLANEEEARGVPQRRSV